MATKKEPIRGKPYSPEQARRSGRSLQAMAERTKGTIAAQPYADMAQTMLDYADLREAEDRSLAELSGVDEAFGTVTR